MKPQKSIRSRRDFIRVCLASSAGICSIPRSLNATQSGPVPAKHMKEARYSQQTPRGVACLICPNECTLLEGEVSECRNRIVVNGKLYTMAYGNPCALNIDPVEKKPLYHFLPASRSLSLATAGCNLACLNCQNWEISQTGPDKTRNIELMPDSIAATAKANDCLSVSYTYSEPVTFYEYVYDSALAARKEGIRNIIVSNGYINREPLVDLSRVIDAANIDLKVFNESTYLRLTGGKLKPVLDSLETYLKAGVWLEITNLVVPGYSDREREVTDMCRWLKGNGFAGVPLHFSRFHPQYKLDKLPPTPVAVLERFADIATSEGISFVYIGNVPGSDRSNTICKVCGKEVIRREGYTITLNNLVDNRCGSCNSVVEGVWK